MLKLVEDYKRKGYFKETTYLRNYFYKEYVCKTIDWKMTDVDVGSELCKNPI